MPTQEALSRTPKKKPYDYGAPDPFEAQAPAQDPQQAVSQPSQAATTGRIDGWVNLQDWMGVNKDQGDQMAQRVAGGVAGRADAATGALNASSQSFRRSVDAGIAPGVDSGVDSATARSSAAKGYAGPSAYDDAGAQAALSKSAEEAGRAGTSEGRGMLANSEFGARGTDSSARDLMLLNTEGQDEFGGLGKAYGDLGGKYAAAKQASDAYAARGRSLSDLNQGKWGALANEKTAADAKAAADAAASKTFNENAINARSGHQVRGADTANQKNQSLFFAGSPLPGSSPLPQKYVRETSNIDDDTYAAMQGYGKYGSYAEWAAAGKPPL